MTKISFSSDNKTFWFSTSSTLHILQIHIDEHYWSVILLFNTCIQLCKPRLATFLRNNLPSTFPILCMNFFYLHQMDVIRIKPIINVCLLRYVQLIRSYVNAIAHWSITFYSFPSYTKSFQTIR